MNEAVAPARESALRMYLVVIGVGIACAVAIVGARELTRPVIQRKRVDLRQRAVLNVLPAARSSAAFRLTDDGVFELAPPESRDAVVFAGYDKDRRLAGLAIEAEGMGYQDVIRVLYGYSFDRQAIVGMQVLQSRETPGLGDRVETDEAFQRNFEGLDVRLAPEGRELARPIQFVKAGAKTSPSQVDGITGATITSRTIAEMLQTSAGEWIPRLRSRRDDFLHPTLSRSP